MESACNMLKEEFDVLHHEFVDVFCGAMLGNQTDKVIDVSPMCKFLGSSNKGNLKTKMDINKIEYTKDRRGRTVTLLIDVNQMKTLLGLQKTLELYESMETSLDNRNLRASVQTPEPAEEQIQEPTQNPTNTDVPSTSNNKEHDEAPVIVSFTNHIDKHSSQFYFRKTDGDFTDVYPVGRPDKRLTMKELRKYMVLKTGSQLNDTMRQGNHDRVFLDSVLLDSCDTNASTYVERKVKDIWKNNNELYEGLYRGKKIRDTELVLVRTQDEYNARVRLVQEMVVLAESSPALEIEKEHTKQEEFKAKAAEADSKARIAEADAKTKQMRIELRKLKIMKDTP